MEWLLDHAETYRSHVRSGPFFKSLARVERASELTWIHQLFHQSREFTQALGLRYSLCHDSRYQGMFAEHAYDQADHPDQLARWMAEHGFLNGAEPGDVPPTQETRSNLAFCWRNAVREPHDVQVVTLNVIGEGVALDFFAAVIPVLGRLDLVTGRYWTAPRGDDVRLGLELCGDVAPDSPAGVMYQRVLWQGANLYHQMLSSWVGERAEPLTPLWTERAQRPLVLEPPAAPSAFAEGTVRMARTRRP